MKSVFVHLRTNLDSVVREAMPAYIDNLNEGNFETEIYFTDHLKWGVDTSWTSDLILERDRRNNAEGRAINFNKAGAGRWYVGYILPTQIPETDSVANAVTFWKWAGSNDQSNPRYRGVFGSTIPTVLVWPVPGNSTDGGTVPRYVKRIFLNLDRFDSVRTNTFYSHDSLQWEDDFPLALKKTITHEFGHTVGMLHRPADRVMPIDTSTVMSNIGILTTGQFVTSDSTFADTSRAHFSVRRPHP